MDDGQSNRLDRIEALIGRNVQQIEPNSQQIGALGDRLDAVVMLLTLTV